MQKQIPFLRYGESPERRGVRFTTPVLPAQPDVSFKQGSPPSGLLPAIRIPRENLVFGPGLLAEAAGL